jgi:hypothetical protein
MFSRRFVAVLKPLCAHRRAGLAPVPTTNGGRVHSGFLARSPEASCATRSSGAGRRLSSPRDMAAPSSVPSSTQSRTRRLSSGSSPKQRESPATPGSRWPPASRPMAGSGLARKGDRAGSWTDRLTRDPEMRLLSSGKAVSTFSIVTNQYLPEQREGRVPVLWKGLRPDRAPDPPTPAKGARPA